jgi:hypothetical protein
MADAETVGRGRTGRRVAHVLALVGAVLGFVLVTALVISASERERGHVMFGLLVVAAGVSLLAVVLVRGAIALEHDLRAARTHSSPNPVARHTGSEHTGPEHKRKNGPVSRIVAAVVVIGCVGAFCFATVSVYHQTARSNETQHDGIAASGVATNVHKVSHATKSRSYKTLDYDVALTEPVEGRATTRLHDPTEDVQMYDVGDRLELLVNRRHPGYAEIAGEPVSTTPWFVLPLIPAVLFLLVLLGLGLDARRHRRTVAKARAHATATAAARAS